MVAGGRFAFVFSLRFWLSRAKWFRDRASQVCRYSLLQLGAWMPLKQRARFPLSTVMGLHRGMDAGTLGREPELERPPFKHSPRNQWVLLTITVILAHLWHGTDVRSLGAMRRCLWKAWEVSHLLSISILLGWAQSELSGSDFSRGFLFPRAVADKQLQWSWRVWHRQGWNSFYYRGSEMQGSEWDPCLYWRIHSTNWSFTSIKGTSIVLAASN